MADHIIAVCGKGGVGKTVVSAMIGRSLLKRGGAPLLLVDADPAGGLVAALGGNVPKTLAGVRDVLIASARASNDAAREHLADKVDYLVLEALVERTDYAILAMGHSTAQGCFCPANTLLRDAVEHLAQAFRVVLIDAEAGIEQINRQVTRTVDRVLVVLDGSLRARATLRQIGAMVAPDRIAVIFNRSDENPDMIEAEGFPVLGIFPEDHHVRGYDREGRSLWDLPDDHPMMLIADNLARRLLETSDHAAVVPPIVHIP